MNEFDAIISCMLFGSSLETRDLRLVLAITEAGGATRAARVLHLSQSAVSHQLRGLEERLGQNVFDRVGRKLTLTPAGERLLQLAREVLQPIAQVEMELKRAATPERQKLRLATQCYTAYHWLPSALSRLTSEHPGVDLSIASEVANDVGSALAEGLLDLGLCVFPPASPRFERIKLFDDELLLAVPRGHPLSKKRFILGRELSKETLVMNPVSSEERDRVQKALFAEGGRFARVIRVPTSEAIVELVRAGLGVSILAGFTLCARLERGEIDAVRLTRRGLRRTWTGVFRRGSRVTAPILTLLETVKAQGIAGRKSKG